MKRAEARTVHVAIALAAITGFVYGWLSYFGEHEDEFGPVSHPWQPTMQHLHVLVVPLFVFVVGMLWKHHIVAKLQSGAPARRRTGLLLVTLAIPMVGSGYAVQVSVDPDWRVLWAWVHGITSTLFTLGFVVHLCVPAMRRITPDRA